MVANVAVFNIGVRITPMEYVLNIADFLWLKTIDAIQIASALFAKVDMMPTYNGSGRKRGIVDLNGLIGNKGSGSLLDSYAPQGNREVQLIFSESSNLTEVTEKEIEDFARCVIRVLQGYHQMGVNSFNLSTFSGPIGEKLEYYSLAAKIISRPWLQPVYRNDTGFLERLHYEADIELLPELLAEELKPLFPC